MHPLWARTVRCKPGRFFKEQGGGVPLQDVPAPLLREHRLALARDRVGRMRRMREIRRKLRATAEGRRRPLGVALDIARRLAVALALRRRAEDLRVVDCPSGEGFDGVMRGNPL